MCEFRLGKKRYRLDFLLCQFGIGIGHGSFVFEVGCGANAADDKLGVVFARKVHRQISISYYAYTRFVGKRPLDGFKAFFDD